MNAFLRIAATAAVSVCAVTSVAAQAEVARLDPKTGTYCVAMSMPGSMIPHRLCASRAEWIERGATIVVHTQRPAAAIQVAAR